MAIEDDDKPRKKITHEIGQDLSLLSVEELTERPLMNSEIERLQQAAAKKRVEGCGGQLFQDVSCSNPISPRPILWQAAGRLSLNQKRRWLESGFRGGDEGVNSKTRPVADMANNP